MNNSNYPSYHSSAAPGVLRRFRFQRGFVFGALILVVLLAFEVFNYSTTDFALGDLLGDLTFLGIRWSTILAIAFCGIDFAGIARLFTPEKGINEPAEVWYLFGAWLLAAGMNATLTWWGVSLAILNHDTLGNALIDHAIMVKIVPIFVALLVWVIRVLIIGTFAAAGERLLWQDDRVRSQPRQVQTVQPVQTVQQAAPMRQLHVPTNAHAAQQPSAVAAFRPAAKTPQPSTAEHSNGFGRTEPTYHPVGASARPPSANPQRRL